MSEDLNYKLQKAEHRIVFLANRLARNEMDMSELSANYETMKVAYEQISNELKQSKKGGEDIE